MARIDGISSRMGGIRVKLGYFFTRRQLGQLVGRDTKGTPDRMVEGVAMYGYFPGLLFAYGNFEAAAARLKTVDDRLKYLAGLKVSTLTHCEYCIDLASQVARRTGLSDEQLLALPAYRNSVLFTDKEKLVLDYAVGMTRTPVDVPDQLFDRLRKHFSEAQIVELTQAIALENMRGRFNHALGVGAAGFSEGMVCALPDVVAPGQ